VVVTALNVTDAKLASTALPRVLMADAPSFTRSVSLGIVQAKLLLVVGIFLL
jgi:hypothetical protein